MSTRLPTLRGRALVEPRYPIEVEPPPAWMTDPRRRCSPLYDDVYQWTSDDASERSMAARKCREHCPFEDECRTRAAERGEQAYVWGGLDFSKAGGRARAAALLEQTRPVVEAA